MTTDNGARFFTYLDRNHDAIVTLGESEAIHRELDLHLLALGVELDSSLRRLLRDGLTAMSLYMFARPRFEYFGWTIHIEEPLVNVFVAGMTREGAVVGRVFTEGVLASGRNTFFCQTGRAFGELQTSSVDVDGADIFDLVEQYSVRSDQQLLRFLKGEGSRAALIAALPGTDRKWAAMATLEELDSSISVGELKLLREQDVTFRCGCDTVQIAKLVAGLYEEEPEDLFRGDSQVEVECPRCGAKHGLTRALFDLHLPRNLPGEGGGGGNDVPKSSS